MPSRSRVASPAKSATTLEKLLGVVPAVSEVFRSLSFTRFLPRGRNPRRRKAKARLLVPALAGLQPLEARLLLTGPTANPNTYADAYNATISIPAYAGVLANDTGGNGPLSAVLVSGPGAGSLTLHSDGSFTYTNTSFPMMGDDSFSYEAFDGSSYSAPANVTISFGNNQPQASGGIYDVLHGTTLNVSAASGVLNGATDPNHLHLTAALESGPSDGSLTLNGDGSFTYTPVSTFAGSDYFSFEAYDGSSYSTSEQVEIDVSERPPTAGSPMYSLLNNQTLNVSAANGVVAASSGDSPLTASLYSGPSHGSLTLNGDGSFSYTPGATWVGTDTFKFSVSDGVSSSIGTVSLTTDYGVVSATDETKVPVDTIAVSRQILSDPTGDQVLTSPLPAGGSGGTTISAAPADGAPATAHNLALAYNSVLAQLDQVIEADIGLSADWPISDTLSASLTFNGLVQPTVYFNMNGLTGSDGHVHVAIQVGASGLTSGRYPYSRTINGGEVASPVTITGAVNVVNDSASPFGQRWDMPGLLRLFNNTVSGVPDGVLLSDGAGNAYYYTQNEDGSYSSPAGAYAFSTLTSLSGGGWQLSIHEGVTFTFNNSGYLLSREERTSETTTYAWSGDELTAITDQFGRSVDLSYSDGRLSSISDYAGNTWNFADTDGELTAITEPNPGGGSPVWQYAYSGGYMASETDPNGNESDFVLDNFHRLSQTTLPDDSTTGDVSEQDFGSGSTSSSDPANLTLATSVTPTTTDADGNTLSYQTDQFGNVVSDTDAAGNTTTIQRDANGLPTVITLPPPAAGDANPVTDIYYDSTGDETYATGAQPTYGTFTYTANGFGQWATFTDSLGNEWTRTFDSSGDILTETDPSGAEVSWTYNAYGQPLTMTMPAPNDASGTVTVHYDYDSDDRLTEILWPDGTSEQFAYNSDDFQTSYEDEDGNVTTQSLDALNRVVSVTNAAGGVTSETLDNDGNVLTTTTPLGEVTSDEYNSMNELVQQTLPAPEPGDASPVLAYTYDANGNELTYTSALGLTTSYSYNNLGKMTQEMLPPPASGDASPTIEYSYNNLGQQVSETNQLGGVSTTAYGNTDVSQVTSASQPPPSGSGQGPTTSYSYDTDGRQNVVTNALNQATTTSFTIDGQVSQTEDNLDNITSYVYGNVGELLSTTNPLDETTSDEYDSRFRLIQTTDANSGVTQIGLDGVGNEVSLTDSDGNETQWTVNALNLPVTETNSLGTTTTAYNADSLVSSIEDADGRVRDFVYNNDQQLTAENWMSGSNIIATMAYGYDLDGELTSASDPNSAYAFTYDGDGNVLTTDNSGTPNVPGVVLTNTYDAMGDRTSQSATIAGTADYLNSYSYDADQNLTSVQQQGQTGGDAVAPKELDYDYNALGLVTDVWAYNTLSGPRTDVYHGASTYDGGNDLTGLDYTSNGGADSIDDFGYTYNAGGLVTSFTSDDGTADYGYDPTGQLTSATYTTASGGHQPANESYSFDANGNRNSTGYSTGSDNLMSSDGTYNYTYDANGNTISRTQIASTYSTQYLTTYTWDYRNRLADVEYYDNNDVLTGHVHYVYDVFDDLIETEVDTTGDGTYNEIEQYVLDVSPQIPAAGVPGTTVSQPVLDFDGEGDLIQRNLVAPSPAGVEAVMVQEAVTSLSEAGVSTWAADDSLGTPRDIVSNSGTVLNHIVDTAFGETAYQSDSSVTWWSGFAGGHEDPITGLVNDYERWYDPETGSWESRDPMGFAAGDTNLRRYVGNSPVSHLDPTGEVTDPYDSDLNGWSFEEWEQWQQQQLWQHAVSLVMIEQYKINAAQYVLQMAQQSLAAGQKAAELAAAYKAKLDALAAEMLQEYIQMQAWQGLAKQDALDALELQKQQVMQAQQKQQEEQEMMKQIWNDDEEQEMEEDENDGTQPSPDPITGGYNA